MCSKVTHCLDFVVSINVEKLIGIPEVQHDNVRCSCIFISMKSFLYPNNIGTTRIKIANLLCHI